MHTVKFLTALVEHHQALVYFLIFFGIVFEGEITLISAGILIHLGALNLPLTVALVLLGSLVKTFYCYYLGKAIYSRWHTKKIFKYIEKRVHYYFPHFRAKPFWSIFISKFIMWLNFSVIVFSGYSKVNFRTYLKAEFLSTIIWAPLLLSLGYFFSYTAIGISREIGQFLLIIALFTLGFLLLDRLIALLYEIFEEHEYDPNEENKNQNEKQ